MTFGASIELARDEHLPAIPPPTGLTDEQRRWLALMTSVTPGAGALTPTP